MTSGKLWVTSRKSRRKGGPTIYTWWRGRTKVYVHVVMPDALVDVAWWRDPLIGPDGGLYVPQIRTTADGNVAEWHKVGKEGLW